ncbi:response regulator [Desulfospira joergensenii]|uniref:response regulator n=1 Tax=Desulfospira joergensenii TaxID=53329 RepID=UPI0003B7BBFD|nr:response regulator [Desulfospira joergensenii]
MVIRKKIVFSTIGMVFLAVLLTVAGVLGLLNKGIETQTRELLQELEIQSGQRIKSGKKILLNTLAYHIQRTNSETADACLDTGIRETAGNGQWKALFARMSEICAKADIDFMVVFDTRGRVLVSFPSMMDEEVAEAHFKELGLFSRFAPAIAQRDLTDNRAVSSIEKWNPNTRRAYNIDCNETEDIVVLSAGVIPNDYMDEPIGYVLTGINCRRLSVPFHHFFKTTGQISLLMDDQIPLIWAGISIDQKERIKESNAFVFDPIKTTGPGNSRINRVELAGKSYHCLSILLVDLLKAGEASERIRVSPAASNCRIIVGEPAGLIDTAGGKIIKEGRAIKKRILITALFITFMVLAVTAGLMGMIGRKISRPIALAAQMSDKIASGDLDHVLDETGTDETHTLSKSMNLMAANLKALKSENEGHIKALEESESRFRILFNSSHQAIALIEKDTGIFVDANARLCEMSKYDKNEIIGKNAEEFGFFFEDEGTRLTDRLNQLDQVKEEEADLRVKGGPVIRILVFAVPIRIKARDFFLIEFYDITEKKRLESQLKQSLKMESIGTLAGGIAHDFNNILGIILGNAELALEELEAAHPACESLESVKTASLRAAEIVSQLLNFSRGSEQELGVIDVAPVINETLDFLRSSIPSTVQIQRQIQRSELPVVADPVQIKQIIMNVSINAYQSMKDSKGTIDARAGITDVDFATARANKDLKPGRHVQIEIADDGSGIPPESMDRIFDPYFTTKEFGKGSGMGLTVVLGIIKTHQGAIMVDSKPGKGTRVSIYLPLAAASLPDSKLISEPDNLFHGSGTILFVDDDRKIVEIFDKMLTRIGYRVKAYTDPLEALAAFKSDPGFFDLVITDMTMPKMTGADLTEILKAERNDIPIIICTGHSDLMDENKAKDIGVAAFIMKPVVFKEMSHRIRQVLEK